MLPCSNCRRKVKEIEERMPHLYRVRSKVEFIPPEVFDEENTYF
jgi:hypothetical protein